MAMLLKPSVADAAEIVHTKRPITERPDHGCDSDDSHPEELCHSASPQPPFMPRPMFRNPESGHESSRTVDGLGRRSARLIGAPSKTGARTPLLPRKRATTASPLMRSRSPAVSISEGAINAATSAHARRHAGTANVRVIARAMLESLSMSVGTSRFPLRSCTLHLLWECGCAQENSPIRRLCCESRLRCLTLAGRDTPVGLRQHCREGQPRAARAITRPTILDVSSQLPGVCARSMQNPAAFRLNLVEARVEPRLQVREKKSSPASAEFTYTYSLR
jgi:hypothetical protein